MQSDELQALQAPCSQAAQGGAARGNVCGPQGGAGEGTARARPHCACKTSARRHSGGESPPAGTRLKPGGRQRQQTYRAP